MNRLDIGRLDSVNKIPLTPDGWDKTVRYTGIPLHPGDFARVVCDQTQIPKGHIAVQGFAEVVVTHIPSSPANPNQ